MGNCSSLLTLFHNYSHGCLIKHFPSQKFWFLGAADLRNSNYQMSRRDFEYDRDNSGLFEKSPTNLNYDVNIDRRNSIENSIDEPSSRSSSTGFDPYTSVPNSDDVKTIAHQMRTMPNYFAAMAAAASMNINYPHQPSAEPSKNDQIYSSSNTSQERSMPRYPQNHSEERYRQNNKSTTSPLIRESSLPIGQRNSSHLTEPLEMSSELHEMVSSMIRWAELMVYSILMHPLQTYLLYICFCFS